MPMQLSQILKRKRGINKRSQDRAKRRFEEADNFFNDRFMHGFEARAGKNKRKGFSTGKFRSLKFRWHRKP